MDNTAETEVTRIMRVLGNLLLHVNENMSACECNALSWEREECPSGRAKLWAADVPEKFSGGFSGFADLEELPSVEVLKFGTGDYIDLHKHQRTANALLIPGRSSEECDLLTFEMFWIPEQSRGPIPFRHTLPYFVGPGIWHSVRRVGEGGYAYILSASYPHIGSDLFWYADE